MIKIKTEGFNELLRAMDNYSKDLGDQVDVILSNGAQNIESEARAAAPRGNTGALASSISSNVSERFNKRVSVEVPYAAYVEFGTGIRVFENKIGFVYSPELQSYANEFFVNGKGTMPATPFLFPAFENKKQEIINQIKEALLPKRFKG